MFHLQLAATFVISWFTCFSFSFSFSFSFIFPALQHTSILFPVQTIIQLTTANLKLFTIATAKLGRLLNRWSTAVPPRPLTQKKKFQPASEANQSTFSNFLKKSMIWKITNYSAIVSRSSQNCNWLAKTVAENPRAPGRPVGFCYWFLRPINRDAIPGADYRCGFSMRMLRLSQWPERSKYEE